MLTTITNLSSLFSPKLSSNIGEGLISDDRTFSGNVRFTFYEAFENINDIEYNNYSNFYLTSEKTLGEFIKIPKIKIINSKILTSMKVGDRFITFTKRIDNSSTVLSGDYTTPSTFGSCTLPLFISNPSSINTTLSSVDSNQSLEASININENHFFEIIDDDICVIYHLYNHTKYYLTVENVDSFVFISEDSNYTIQTFNFSLDGKKLYLFASLNDKIYRVSPKNDKLSLKEITTGNKISSFSEYIELGREIYNWDDEYLDAGYVSYTNDNKINNVENVNNNFLLYRNDDNILKTITLKNQMLRNDTFSSSNNLLSSSNMNFYVDGMRDYTSIFKSIDSEKDVDLKLNYVYYNKEYYIKPGNNYIVSPDNMEPFEQLNINDTKFKESGSFPFTYPLYADKVYLKNDNNNKIKNGQFLLFTWLSGSPFGGDSIWVDRYYYPDLIRREEAVYGKPSLLPSSSDNIQDLISNNLSLKNKTAKIKYFDKKSDMVFTPNDEYIYSRISKNILDDVKELDIVCVTDPSVVVNTNYFKDINNSGSITLSFYFNGDEKSWSLGSVNPDNDSGIIVSKSSSSSIDLRIKLYNNTTRSSFTLEETIQIKKLKVNYLSISIDTITGYGYVLLNDKIEHNMKFREKEFFRREMIPKDLELSGVMGTPFMKNEYINNMSISSEYTEPENSFVKQILDGFINIDDITISLPCGMRNSTDDIGLLNVICNNSAFKSNMINIYLKNTGFDDDVTSEMLKEYIIDNINKNKPLNIKVNDIKFINNK